MGSILKVFESCKCVIFDQIIQALFSVSGSERAYMRWLVPGGQQREARVGDTHEGPLSGQRSQDRCDQGG